MGSDLRASEGVEVYRILTSKIKCLSAGTEAGQLLASLSRVAQQQTQRGPTSTRMKERTNPNMSHGMSTPILTHKDTHK